MASSSASHAGGCECGGVRYRIDGPLRHVVNCHCGQCRRTHGHFAAYANAPRDALRFESDATLGWYASSPDARRGFCRRCGASLFWEAPGSGVIGIAAGTLDMPTGLTTIAHIYMADAGDYYAIADGLPQHAGDHDLPHDA